MQNALAGADMKSVPIMVTINTNDFVIVSPKNVELYHLAPILKVDGSITYVN